MLAYVLLIGDAHAGRDRTRPEPERRPTMDPLATGEIQCRAGDEVFDAGEHKIGKVVEHHARYITVRHGLLRKEDYFVPMSAVNSCNDGKVYLNVAKDDIAAQGWDAPPPISTEA